MAFVSWRYILKESPNQWMDEGRGHARLVKQDTCPDTEGVGRIFLEVVSQSRWSYFLYCLTKEWSSPAAGDKYQWGFLGSVTGNWHVVRFLMRSRQCTYTTDRA
jgi:hypothetical protein